MTEVTPQQVRLDQLTALSSWSLQGRVNAIYEEEVHTPRVRWQQAADTYNIRLYGAFNAGSTSIQGEPGHVTLERSGDVIESNSPEELILQQLGYEIPVSELTFWIRGLPTPGQPGETEYDEFNQLLSLDQSGWNISYEDYRLFGELSLPRRVHMSRPQQNISLEFFGLVWTLEHTGAQ